jgi:gliding motility-associated-like protein
MGVILEGLGSSEGANVIYEWTLNNQIIGTDISLEAFEEGTYVLQVTDTTTGCTDLFELEIVLPPVDLDPIIEINGESCPGELDGSFFIDTVFGGQTPYLYALENTPFTTNNQFDNLSPGNYTLTIQDSDGCEYQTEIIIPTGIPLIIDLGENQQILLGDSIQLSIATNSTLASIIWDNDESLSCLDCIDPFATPLNQTNYTVTVIDINGCIAGAEITIRVDKQKRVFIPNTFSPNSDGINDFFMVYGGPEVDKVLNFKIYDRWGATLFSATDFLPNDMQFSWDGTFRGEELSPGVYLYYVEVEFIDGRREVLAGDLTLLR